MKCIRSSGDDMPKTVMEFSSVLRVSLHSEHVQVPSPNSDYKKIYIRNACPFFIVQHPLVMYLKNTLRYHTPYTMTMTHSQYGRAVPAQSNKKIVYFRVCPLSISGCICFTCLLREELPELSGTSTTLHSVFDAIHIQIHMHHMIHPMNAIRNIVHIESATGHEIHHINTQTYTRMASDSNSN